MRPSDRRILELMTRRQEQERLQERRARQEHQRWRQEWLQELRLQAEREERRGEAVEARRRAEAWESRRRREELQQRHTQSLENLAALIRGREERAALELASHRGRKVGRTGCGCSEAGLSTETEQTGAWIRVIRGVVHHLV